MTWTDAVSVRAVWIRRRPGPLLVPFDPPELTIDAAITRGWRLDEWRPRPLLLPNPPDFLPTYPLPWPRPRDDEWFPHDWRPLIVTMTPDPNYL